MAFMSLEKNFFPKEKQVLLNFEFFLFFLPFFLFVCLLTCFINERSLNTLLLFEEGAIEHILRPIYDFTSEKAFSVKI